MGCSQSKTTTDAVVECVSEDTFVVEAPTNTDVSAPVVAIEDPPASTEEPPLVCASVPTEEVEKTAESVAAPVEEEVKKVAEFAAALVEGEVKKSAEFGATHIEEVVETDTAYTVKETSVLKIDAPVEEVAETPAPGSEEEIEAFTLESAHVVEDNVPKPEAEIEALVEEEDEPKSEVVAVAPESETKATESSLTFKAENVTFNDKGVAFYNFDGSDSSNPVNDVHISKRYSDFKALHAQLTGKDGKVIDLPALPTASFLQGRNNRKMLEDRKTQFTILLNAIAAHPLALHSDVFKAFLA
ncbi:unnamed protein product [Peronospora destructor]|uniref:PX domain-containing protein n=1 Tax=Peronospora destructor TaxID=86335 RepID=A0AAV0VCZ2_9STRA|nr:unnamed protein product [Peronospora destructor]